MSGEDSLACLPSHFTFPLDNAREGAHRVEEAERENHGEHGRDNDHVRRVTAQGSVDLRRCKGAIQTTSVQPTRSEKRDKCTGLRSILMQTLGFHPLFAAPRRRCGHEVWLR